MPILSAQKLKLLFGEVEIFSDVSLEVNEHARIGIVGPNGGGKTSLLRMLLGELDSDAGAVIRGSSIRIGYVSQIPQSEAEGSLRDEIMTAFDDLIALEEGMAAAALDIQQTDGRERTQAENQYSSLVEQYEARGGYDYQNLMERVVVGVGLTLDTLDTPASVASGGQRTRAARRKLCSRTPISWYWTSLRTISIFLDWSGWKGFCPISTTRSWWCPTTGIF